MPVNKQLVNYIKKEQAQGKNKKQIVKALFEAQWHKDAIDDAFKAVEGVKKVKKSAGRKRTLLLLFVLILLAFILGVVAYFYLYPSLIKQDDATEQTGFQKYEANDTKRVKDLELIQDKVEDYYKKNKTYPPSLSEISDAPKNPSGNDYTYTAIGKPAFAYTLVGQLESPEVVELDGDIDGFYTLKNEQGKK